MQKPFVDDFLFQQVTLESFPVVERFYSENKYKVRCGKLDSLYVLTFEQAIVAAVRLTHPKKSSVNSDAVLLRNLYVAKEHRGRGLARKIMTSLLEQAEQNIYLFSLSHLTDFYVSVGFSQPSLNEKIPVEISELAQTYAARHRDWVLMCYQTVNSNQTHK